jgi:hypothetical protein
MVRYKQKFDNQGKVYFPKVLRESGLAPELTIAPNTRCAVVYPSGLPADQVLESLDIIRQDLALSAKSELAREAVREKSAHMGKTEIST